MQSKNEFLFDKRIVNRNIAGGKATAADFQKSLDALVDLEDECEKFTAESLGPEARFKSEVSSPT